VNLLNGKFYIGAHKTTDLNDGYLGSGTYIRRAVAKHGIVSFQKNVLFYTNSEEEMWNKEEEVILAHKKDPLCMNVRASARGGFDYINNSGLNGARALTESGERKSDVSNKLRYRTDEKYRLRMNEVRRKVLVRLNSDPDFCERRDKRVAKASKVWTGQKHRPDSCQKMSESHKGEKNHFSGRKWMHHSTYGSKPVRKEDIEQHIRDGWKFGRVEKVERVVKEKPKTKKELAPMGSVWCPGHQRFLPSNEFHRWASTATGFQPYCIECRKKKRKQVKFSMGIAVPARDTISA
jgi:hypothetical protein